MKMTNKVYDVLKWVALIVLPAIATLYSTLSITWGWNYGEQILASVGGLEIFLGSILQYSNSKYKKTNTAATEINEVSE